MRLRGKSLGILLFYYLGFSRIRNLALRLKQKPVTRFVIFHDILPEEKIRFQSHLLFLKKCTNVVSLDDFFSGRLSTEKINVVITFDDGYKSWISVALPILLKLKLPATFFVSSGFVGLSKEKEAEFLKSKMFLKLGPRKISGGLSFEDVTRIFNAGFTIGGHTINHSILEKITDSVQLRYEIEEDKTRLEKIIGQSIDYFAYPYGVCNNPKINLSEVLKEAGYKGAVTTSSGFNNKESDLYLLNREITYANMPERVFRARVYGNYDAVYFLKKRIQMVLQRQ
ncbi:polysaccharide deacetylase family protein [Acidobacteriota bacterium]